MIRSISLSGWTTCGMNRDFRCRDFQTAKPMDFIQQAAEEKGSWELEGRIRCKYVTIRIQKQQPVHVSGTLLEMFCIWANIHPTVPLSLSLLLHRVAQILQRSSLASSVGHRQDRRSSGHHPKTFSMEFISKRPARNSPVPRFAA